jgi:hypothetical protein
MRLVKAFLISTTKFSYKSFEFHGRHVAQNVLGVLVVAKQSKLPVKQMRPGSKPTVTVQLEEFATGGYIAGGLGGSIVVHGVKGLAPGLLERCKWASPYA